VLLLAGCVVAPPPPFPTPPQLPAEVIPLPPVSETQLVWQPGDWTFVDGSYRYEPGHYVPAAGHGSQWVFGHWAPDPAGPIWVPGHWQ
jgi:hypothetical protein